MSEWKFRLDEIAEIVDCEHKTAPTVDSSIYRSIRTTDITNGIIDYNNANCVDYETYLEWTKRAIPEAHDIILAREAPVGEVGWIREGKQVCLGQRTVLIKVKSDNVSKRFLLYYLINPETKYELQVQSVGSVVSHLNMKNIRAFYVSLPPIHEQEAIASVLSSLDDKIDLLHRQNKTLEAMAEALFRQWFVEEAGEDWEDGCLGDFAVNVTKSAKVADIKSDDVYVGLEHIERRNISLVKNGSGGDVESNKYCFKEMDILFGKLRPYFHKVCFAPFDGICSTDILVIRPKKKHLFGYCLFAFFQNDVVEYANLGSGGTRMPRTNWETLSQYPVAVPDENKLIKFNEIAQSFIEKIAQNQKQIRTIEQLRDTLLPKLMNGEVRVNYE